MALPRKTDIVETERVILNIPKGIYDLFMKELIARNERLKDNGDAAFFGPYAYELLTEDLKKELSNVTETGREVTGIGPRRAERIVAGQAGCVVKRADSHTLDLGGRIAELRTWGLAHTRSDQVVWLPEERILFTGDLVEERCFAIFPYFPPEDADVDGELCVVGVWANQHGVTRALARAAVVMVPEAVAS